MDWNLFHTIVLSYIPHGHCYLWKSGLVSLHAISDGLIALAYFSIPCTLGYFVFKRKDLPYPWLFGLFGVFIISCGITHIFEIWTLWHPTYWLSGSAKALTAAVSMFTAVQLFPVVPQALALTSPAELEAANQALKREITERQLIEGELQQSQQLLDNAFELSLIGNALVTPEGDWIKVNPALCQMLGYAESELLQTNFRDITYPEDLAADQNYIDQLLCDEIHACEFEKRYIHRHGHIIWALLSVSLVRDSEGQPLNFIVQIQDITGRKQAEETLRSMNEQLELAVNERTTELEKAYARLKKSKAQYQDLYDHAPDMYGSVDIKSKKIIRCNQTLMQELCYCKKEVLGRPIFELYHPDCHPQAERAFQTFMKTGKVKDAQLALQRKDGSRLEVSLNAQAVRDDEGNILYSRSSWRDITKRKRLEAQLQEANSDLEQRVQERTQALISVNERLQQEARVRQQLDLARQQSEERLQLALEGSGDGLWDWDITTGALYLSPQWLAMLGYETDDFPAEVSTWKQLVHPEDQPWVMKLLSDHLQDSSNPYVFDYRVKTKSGQWKWIGNYGKVVARDSGGEPLRMAGMHKDISIRKQREEQIKASLKEKEVMLQEIHHRVKNNLQVISSLLNLQARNVKDPGTLEVIKESQNRVSSMALVHEKLYQSKNLDKINFAEYVNDLVNSLIRSYQSQSGRVKVSIDVESVALQLDTAIPCGLIINELVSNALKYAFPDCPTPEIKISMQTDAANELKLVIADNGVGISPDFDWRQSRSLGLRLVSNLTRQLSGKLDLLRDEGTAFSLTFPAQA